MSPLHFRAFVLTMMLIGLGSSSCGSQGPDAAGDSVDDLDSAPAKAALDYFCVDHPCADLDPRKLGECYRDINAPNRMLVRIENLGGVNAGSSTATFWVDYYPYPAEDIPVPPLNAKPAIVTKWDSSWYEDISIALPLECLGVDGSPGCSWHFKADAYNRVREISDNNNVIAGACIY